MAIILFTTFPLRPRHLRRQPALSRRSRTWLNNFLSLWGLLWHLGKSTTRGERLRTWASVTRSKHFKLRRASLLSDWIQLCTLAPEQFYVSNFVDIAAMVFQKSNPATSGVCVCNIWTDVKLPWLLPCYFYREPVYICRGVQSTVETAPNEAVHLCWKQSLINSVYLQNLVSTVDQAVTLRCFESTRLPQSVLHASEPSSDFRRNHIADSIMTFWHFFAEIMSPTNFGSFWEQSPKHYFGFSTCWSKTLWILVLTTFDNIGCPTSFSRSTSCGSFTNLTI